LRHKKSGHYQHRYKVFPENFRNVTFCAQKRAMTESSDCFPNLVLPGQVTTFLDLIGPA
jgi:hypothetical protein